MQMLSSMEKRVVQLLKDQAGKTFSCDEIAHRLNYQGTKMFKKLVRAVNFLEHAGEIEQTRQGHYFIAVKQSRYEGTYRANLKGYGFISFEDAAMDDMFVPRGRALNAMNGDKVAIEIIKTANPLTGKGSEVQVVEVLERSARQMVGEFHLNPAYERAATGFVGYVKPHGDYGDQVRIHILPEGIQPADEAIVVVKITGYPLVDRPNDLQGLVAKEIGHKHEPGVDILSVLYQFGIPHEFPENVREQAQAVSQEITADDLVGREDLRDELIMTIDGADAKDLDDAISLTVLPEGGYRLGVHIADVSHYVTEGSPMDHEAYQRGTSVYLTDRVVPMLPQRLSNGICSLHPHEDRLTISCEMTFDATGIMTQHRIFLSVIHSSYRMTYRDVNAILEGDETLRQQYEEIVPTLLEMATLHHLLEAKRFDRGALDFDAPEAKVIVDATGHPIDIEMRERAVAERLIESFMLAANEAVARTYMVKEYPMIYRVHEQPESDRMQRFAEFMASFGIVLRGDVENIAPKQLQTTLAKVKGEPFEMALSTMMLRSMKQARYSEEPLGHYGLATHEYTHFTSPIRRYPDLIVHRLIHRYLAKRPAGKDVQQMMDRLSDIAEQSSKMERRAVEAERDVTAMKKAEYMLDKIDEEFEGVISSVTSFGMFVMLPNTIEGLIAIKDIPGDYYEFDQAHLMLIGQRTGRIFRIGQHVTIRVAGVNVSDREIDFSFVNAEEVEKADVQLLRDQRKQAKKQQRAERQHRAFSRKQAKNAATKASMKDKGRTGKTKNKSKRKKGRR